MRRGQERAENHLKVMHTSAKQYFEVVCTHLDAFGTGNMRFVMDFRGFSRFWEPRPAQLAPSRPRLAELLPSRRRLAELLPSSLGERIWRIY